MLCQDVIEILEQHSPVCYAEGWDNVGLLAGRRNKEVKKVLVALDATDAVIKQAVEMNIDMLITHHPLIFSARKSVTEDDIVGRRLVKLLGNDISYYAMHTNFDVKGMAQLSAEKLKLQEVSVLEQTSIDDMGNADGIGRYGRLPQIMQLKELAEYVKECFELDYVTVCGDPMQEVELAAVSGGSGKSLVPYAIEAGVQALITGDMDYHTVIDARAEGLSIIDAGHYGTEKMFVSYMSQYMKEKCSGIEIVEAIGENPFYII